MKKIFFAIGLFVTMGISSAFANEVKVSPRVLESFKTEFTNVQDVSWLAGDNYFRAAFTMNEQRVFAYYSTEGELMSVGRYISSLQLPITLFSDLKNNYSNYWISDLFEVSNSEGIHYYVTLENADTKLMLLSSNGAKWSSHSKNKKA